MPASKPIMKPGGFFLAREGYPFLLIFILLAILGAYFFWPLGLFFGALFLFSLNFFRDPQRVPPQDPRALVSPADGKVLKVEALPGGKYISQAHQKISIFMSALDVHVNRIPCDGTIKKIHYFPGQFFVASLDKASEKNERNAVILETPQGQEVAFVQIAGLVARRIVCYLKEGLQVSRGERYGMIRFGSRMEVCIPPSWKVLVKPGDKVKAGSSELAQIKEVS
jgi:phosphatidylserine decarboxylase